MSITGILLLGSFVLFAALMVARILPALLALPFMAAWIAWCAGLPFLTWANEVLLGGALRLSSAIALVVFGSMFAKVIQKTGISDAIIKKAAELAGDRPIAIATQSMELPPADVREVAVAGTWHIFDGQYKKRVLGIIPVKKHKVRVLNRNGVVCLQREGLGAIVCTKSDLQAELKSLLEDTVEYGTTGGELPGLFAYYGEKQVNLSGLVNREQVLDLMKMEAELLPDNEKIIVLAVR